MLCYYVDYLSWKRQTQTLSFHLLDNHPHINIFMRWYLSAVILFISISYTPERVSRLSVNDQKWYIRMYVDAKVSETAF